jgi:hypothetical protein
MGQTLDGQGVLHRGVLHRRGVRNPPRCPPEQGASHRNGWIKAPWLAETLAGLGFERCAATRGSVA